MNLPSIASYKKHGVPRSMLAYLLINRFHIPNAFQDLVQNYYILRWEGKYLKQRIVDGTLLHQGRQYIVVFHNCTYGQATGKDQVFLSFRVPMEDYELPSYVLIKPDVQAQEQEQAQGEQK